MTIEHTAYAPSDILLIKISHGQSIKCDFDKLCSCLTENHELLWCVPETIGSWELAEMNLLEMI